MEGKSLIMECEAVHSNMQEWTAAVKTESDTRIEVSRCTYQSTPNSTDTSVLLTPIKVEPLTESGDEEDELQHQPTVPENVETPSLFMKCEEDDVKPQIKPPEGATVPSIAQAPTTDGQTESLWCHLCRVKIFPEQYHNSQNGGQKYSEPDWTGSGLHQQDNAVHTNREERPTLCAGCEKGITKQTVVLKKQITHSKKKLKCSYCGKGFQYKSNLKRHEQIHTGEKPHYCDMCGNSFSRLSNLEVHKRSHTGERPYKCSVCDKAFARTDDLNVHKRTHTGEKPYQCPVCKKRFSKKTNLNRHEQTHTDDRPFTCTICGQGFKDTSNLIAHGRKHRRENL